MFSEVTKAWRCLENESTRQKCLDIVEEAEAVVAKRVRKLLAEDPNTAVMLESCNLLVMLKTVDNIVTRC